MEVTTGEQQLQNKTIQSFSVVPLPVSTSEIIKTEQLPQSSLLQSLLQEQPNETEDTKKKKKKKAKTARQKELDRLTKETKDIFDSPNKLNVVCERINSLLSNHKKRLLNACQILDKYYSGYLSYEQFRLVMRDHVPQMSTEDLFVLMKLHETEGGSIDYRAILDSEPTGGILRHIKQITVPLSTDIVLEKKSVEEFKRPFNEPFQVNQPRYVTLHLRFITFDAYNAYPGHIHLTVPDYMSVYALSKMIIDETDFATRSISIFQEKIRSRHGLFEPMRSLEDYNLTGACIDGTHNQVFPTYTLYYDYSPLETRFNCPILKCDYYIKSREEKLLKSARNQK